MGWRFLVVVSLVAGVSGCSNPGKKYCAKAKECCGSVSACDEINKEGEGFEERCALQFTYHEDALATYGNSACDTIVEKTSDFVTCMGGIECSDINTSDADRGHVAKCDTESIASCQAYKASGNACGFDYANMSCDNAKAFFGN